MKRFLFGLAALPFLAGVAFAAENVALGDAQIDAVTAGFGLPSLSLPILEIAVSDPGTPPDKCTCPNCWCVHVVHLAPLKLPMLPNTIIKAITATTFHISKIQQ